MPAFDPSVETRSRGMLASSLPAHAAARRTLAATGLAAAAVLALALPAGRPLPAPLAPAPAAGGAAPVLPVLYVRDGARFAAPGAGLSFGRHGVVLAATGARVRFVGAAPDARLVGAGRRPGVVNVLVGPRARWRTRLPVYAGVVYAGLYPGIDLRFAGREATWTVAPGADPRRIRWRGPRFATPPVAWQRVDGARRAVAVRYATDARGRTGFAVGRHDPRAPLSIVAGTAVAVRARQAAPAALGFSTFFGGRQWDEAMDVETDATGATYVAGFSESTDARTARPIRSRHRGIMDVYVAKFAPDGRTLRYATFLGGADLDVANALAVDRAGNAYVAGRTGSSDFPLRAARQARLAGRACQALPRHESGEPCHDAFVAKIAASGGALVYSTYLGGSRNEEAIGVAVDRSGRAFVTGNTDSTDFPTRGALQGRFRSQCESDVPCPTDAFVTKLSADGRSLVYSTYLGGTKGDTSGGIAVDRAGAAYLIGATRSADFPTRRARQATLRGRQCGPPPSRACPDAFVVKLRPSGRALAYGTYLGGTETETAGGIAVDRAGNAYLTGSTQSPDFPTARPFQAAIGNASCSTTGPPKELCDDAYVTKLSADGRRLRYSTFLGGNAEDQGLGIAVDATGAAHVAGSTDSRAFRIAAPVQARIGGGIDAYVARIGPAGALQASTYLGGTEAERANAVAVDARGRVHVAGRTLSPNFPTATPLQGALAGDYDMFVTMLR
jgi:hypothetical protein